MNNKDNNAIPTIRSRQNISIDIHQEYIAYHNNVDLEHEKESVVKKISTLFDATVSLKEKKRILFVLGHCGTLESYNALKRYCTMPDQDLAAWATICLTECRSRLAGEILEDDSEIVMSSAGGDGTRLRFYFIISSVGHETFTPSQQKRISIAVKSMTKKTDAILESLSFGDPYALLTVLIPPDTAPAEVIEEVINECNSKKRFLRFHYFVSNVQEPTQEIVKQYLDDLL